jgi:hypothetical protein
MGGHVDDMGNRILGIDDGVSFLSATYSDDDEGDDNDVHDECLNGAWPMFWPVLRRCHILG